MNQLMSHNIYEFENSLIICGSCLPNMDKQAFAKLEKMSKNIFFVCLEEIHMNMVALKIASILRLGKVKDLIFVSVDKSPHCVQLHYIRNELEKIMDLQNINIKNFVSDEGDLVEISKDVILASKCLMKIQKLKK